MIKLQWSRTGPELDNTWATRLRLRPILFSFLLPFWLAVRSYRPHLKERDPIWGDDWSYSPFIRRSPSWRFSGVFLSFKANAKRYAHSPRDHFIITLIISNRRDWRDTRGKWRLVRNPDRNFGTATLVKNILAAAPMAPWKTGPRDWQPRLELLCESASMCIKYCKQYSRSESPVS